MLTCHVGTEQMVGVVVNHIVLRKGPPPFSLVVQPQPTSFPCPSPEERCLSMPHTVLGPPSWLHPVTMWRWRQGLGWRIYKLWNSKGCQKTTRRWGAARKRLTSYPQKETYNEVKWKDEIWLFLTIWMGLENTRLSEISQTEKVKNHVISFICEILKWQ